MNPLARLDFFEQGDGVAPPADEDELMAARGHQCVVQESGGRHIKVRWNDAGQRFIMRNSWGTAWGMQGYFTIPYAYLTDRPTTIPKDAPLVVFDTRSIPDAKAAAALDDDS